MPTEPKGEKRPADVNARVVMIAKIATGEIEDAVPDDGKNKAAQTGFLRPCGCVDQGARHTGAVIAASVAIAAKESKCLARSSEAGHLFFLRRPRLATFRFWRIAPHRSELFWTALRENPGDAHPRGDAGDARQDGRCQILDIFVAPPAQITINAEVAILDGVRDDFPIRQSRGQRCARGPYVCAR